MEKVTLPKGTVLTVSHPNTGNLPVTFRLSEDLVIDKPHNWDAKSPDYLTKYPRIQHTEGFGKVGFTKF